MRPLPSSLFMTASRTRRILLVVGIVGVLATVAAVATIAIPNYVAAGAANEAMACTFEYKTVQDGLYSYMARYNVDTVPAATTNNMASPLKLSPAFVHTLTTVFIYTWDTRGRITMITAKPGGPFIPAGCFVSGS